MSEPWEKMSETSIKIKMKKDVGMTPCQKVVIQEDPARKSMSICNPIPTS